MGWYCKKGEKSQMVGLWDMFTVRCKNQNKNNLLIKKICAISTFFKLVNLAKGAIFS